MHGAVARSAAETALRAAVFADPGLQARLAAATEPDALLALLAAETGHLALSAEETARLTRPDPLGLDNFAPRPPDGAKWPGEEWLPVHAGVGGTEAYVDWLYAGRTRLTAPFYQETIRQLQRLPFNRAFRYRMRLADFVGRAERAPAPDGFIFHMSRCGSTLTAQMLAALPESVVVSEPPPLDEVLQLSIAAGEDPAIRALRAVVAAFGRRGGRPFVLKLDAWHALALPLFRRAFPDTPWIFLYRAPIEVLVSQMRERGAQMVPSLVPPSVFGLATEVPDEEYCARVLAAICRAAAGHLALGGGRLVNYAQLPDAVETEIAPHFAIAVDGDKRAAMRAAALRDAKAPYQAFADDSEEKRRAAGDLLRALAERHLAPVYARLEAMRAGSAAEQA